MQEPEERERERVSVLQERRARWVNPRGGDGGGELPAQGRLREAAARLSAVAAALALQVQCDRVQRVERELALSRDVSSGLRGLERLVPMICRCVQARKSAI